MLIVKDHVTTHAVSLKIKILIYWIFNKCVKENKKLKCNAPNFKITIIYWNFKVPELLLQQNMKGRLENPH